MAPIYRDVNTGVIAEHPENIFNHPVLGASLEPYESCDPEFEEDKVVVDAPTSSARIVRTATPKPPTTAPKKEDD